jgi:adenosylhomocysteine nucleosidase
MLTHAVLERVVVLFAVSQELGPFARRITPALTSRPSLPLPFRHGRLGDREVLCLAGGMGPKRAAAAAEAVLRGWKPDLLVMAGVAGALSPELAVADLVIGDAVLSDGRLLLPPVVPALPDARYRTGPLLSLPHVLVTAEDKRAAAIATPVSPEHRTPNTEHRTPLVVEMETAAVARVAIAHGIPWSAVRAVSDTAAESLPLDFNRLRSADGDLPTSRVALAAMMNPGAIPGLIRLGRNTSLAAEAVAGFLADWITRGG